MRKTISLILALLMLVSVIPIGVIAADDACEHINTVTEAAIPNTCTENGFTEGVYCNDCGEWLVVQEKIYALGHSWGDYEYNNDATCTSNGKEIAECERCDAIDMREVYGTALEHEYEAEVIKEANCKEEGLIAYTCDCGYAYTNTVSKTDHADDNIDDVCDVCGEVLNSFSGQCGENVYWEFDESTDTLTISGAGKIDDAVLFDEETGDFVANEEKDFLVNMPWYHLKNQIRTIVIEEGITEIGACAFHSLFYLTKVEFPSTLEVVGCAAFCDCIRLEELDLPDSVNTLYVSNYNEIAIKKIVLPESLEATPKVPGIDEVFDFNMCAYLESITIPEEIGAIEAVVSAVNPSIRNIYNYSTEAIVKFDNRAVSQYWYGDEATAEYATITMGAALASNEYDMTDEELEAFVLEKIIEYYGENYAEKIPYPNLIETVPDYIKVYCYENSAQHLYCVDNGVNFVLIDENTHLDADNNGVCDVCGLEHMCGEKVYYEFDDVTGTVTISGEGSTYNYERYGTKFEDVQSPFRNDDNIRKVIIEEGITSLGDYLYFGCCNIEEIQIPETVTYIGMRAVYGKMTQFNIGKNISYVDRTIEELSYIKRFTVDIENKNYSADNFGCLYDKNKMSLEAYPADNDAKEFYIPEGVEFVNAGFDCANKLEFVYIHKDVRYLSDGIFTSAFNLKKIIVDESNEHYFNDENGALYNVIPETGKIILKCYPTGNTRTVFEIVDGTNTIWHSVFNGDICINTLIIPESVNSMIWGALPNGKVEDAYSLYDIYYYGTKEQWNEIEIDETNNQVLENVTIHFNYDGISPIIVKSGPCGENVTYEFYSDGTLIISGTGAMADNFFEFSKLDIKNVIIKSGVTTIAGWAFSRCSMLTDVTISDSVTSIGDSVFSSCDSLSDIVIPDSVKSIGKAAFFSCDNLISITIPNSVTSIGDGSFCDCKGLTSITFGKSVKSIGKDAFDDCINLTDVYFNGTRSEWNSIIIHSGNDSLLAATIHFDDCRHTEDGYATITKDENINEPTYTKDGSYDEVTVCENCGAELSRERKAIPDLSLLETIVGNIEETFKGFYDALARVITKLLMLIKKMG